MLLGSSEHAGLSVARQIQKKKRLGIAADFFPSPSDWEKLRPKISQLLVDSRARAAKQIAHPTYARLAVDRAQKDWDVRRISNEVTEVVEKFIRHVPMPIRGSEVHRTEGKYPLKPTAGFQPCCI
jgi:hypothetical protein